MSDLENLPIHESSLAEARMLADLQGVMNDLGQVESFLLRWLVSRDDPILGAAFFSASLITYRRCFNTGVRSNLERRDIAALKNKAVVLHDYLCEQASKLVAHSVNPFDQTKVGIVVRGTDAVGVAPITQRLVGLQEADIRQWLRLVEVIRKAVVEPRVQQAIEALLVVARRLPLSEITTKPILMFATPGPEAAGKARK